MSEQSIGIPVDNEGRVDTNTDAARIKRAENQFNFEISEMDKTQGQDFKSRFFTARKAIFKDFDNVYGESVEESEQKGQLVDNNRSPVLDAYSPYTEAAEIAMPSYEQKVDGWYNKIKQLPEGSERDAMAERFASSMFVGGIMIHPSVDGNGQTFKLLTQSYLQDLCPNRENIFVPIKYTSKEWSEEKEMAELFLGGGWVPPSQDLSQIPVPRLEPADAEEETLLDAIYLMRKARRNPNLSEERKDEITQKLAGVAAAETQNSELNQDESLTELSFGNDARRRIETKGLHNKWEVDGGVSFGSGMKIDRASWAIVELWSKPEGIKLVEDYILRGEVEVPKVYDRSHQELYEKAIRVFSLQRDRINRTLETREEHTQRHNEIMSLYNGVGLENKTPFPDIKYTKPKEEEIEEVAKPVVQQARVEALKLKIKASEGQLSESQQKLLERYDHVVQNAIDNNWMTYDQVNLRVKDELLKELSEKEVSTATKIIVADAKSIISNLDLSNPEGLVKNDSALVIIREELQILANKVNRSWEEIAVEAGADDQTIEVLKNAGNIPLPVSGAGDRT